MQSAGKTLRRHEEREEKARASLSREADAIVEESRRRLRELVGLKRYDELKAGIRKERLALRELQQPPEGLKRDFRMDQRAGKKRVDTLLRKHGVSADKVSRIQNDTREKLQKLFASARSSSVPGYSLENHHDKWRHLTGLTSDILLTDPIVAPPDDDPNDPHRWFWFTPPYPKCHHSGWADNKAYSFDWEFFCTLGGWIGTELTVDLPDAGDADLAFLEIWSEIELMFNAPIAGSLEVVIRAQCLRDLYEVSFVDEFGLSSGAIYQESSLYLNSYMLGGGRSLAVMSFNGQTDDDPPMNSDKLILGKHYFANLFLNRPVEAASVAGPTMLEIGCKNFTRVWSDDNSVHSRAIFMWQLHSVGVRIAP